MGWEGGVGSGGEFIRGGRRSWTPVWLDELDSLLR